MPHSSWKFTPDSKAHTQDGPNLVQLMKSVGHGKRQVLALDLGCGDGIITYEMLKHRKATDVVALDINRAAVEAARANLAGYTEEGAAEVLHQSASKFFANKKNYDRFDRFVINPPFFKAGSGRENKRDHDQRARHEGSLKLKIWVTGARRCLKTGGELYCVFPTERLAELISELVRAGVEPKEIWWSKYDIRQRRFFLRAIRGAKSGLTVHRHFDLKA